MFEDEAGCYIDHRVFTDVVGYYSEYGIRRRLR
jgi:hypothetical protein